MKVLFVTRVEKTLKDKASKLAMSQGITLSNVINAALSRFVETGGEVATTDEKVPARDEYLKAFKALNDANQFSVNDLQMLKVHFNKPGRSITATQMSKTMGWKRFTAANLHYGNLAKKLSRTMRFNHDHIDLWSLVYFEKDSKTNEWIWFLRDEVVDAIQDLKLV